MDDYHSLYNSRRQHMMDNPMDDVATSVQTCGKCKDVFMDIESFFNHKNNHCISDDETIGLASCIGVTVSDGCDPERSIDQDPDTMSDSNNDIKAEVDARESSPSGRTGSPIVQTVMLASGLIDMPGDETAGTFLNDRGEPIHFVVLPGHQCPKCPQFFQTNSTMEAHINQCHVGTVEKEDALPAYTCPQCQRICKSASSLRKHMDTHSNERPFKCDYENCTYSFKTKGSLVRHERRHTDSRPFKCGLCQRSFRESGALNRHKKSRMPCSQKRDTELPNYGKNVPLPGQPLPPETDDDPLESDLLSEEFLVPELNVVKDSELLEEKESELLRSSSKHSELLESSANEAEILILQQDGDIVRKMQQSVVVESVPIVEVSSTDNDGPIAIHHPLTDNGTEFDSNARHTQQTVPVTDYFNTCQMCGTQFQTNAELKMHLRDHLSTGSFLCDQCSFIGNRQEFTAHITHIHSAPITPNAEFMSSERVYPAKALDSLRTVSPQQAVREAIQIIQQLLILDNATPDETIAVVKEKVLTLKGIKTCPVCDKIFRSPSYLRHHIRVHTGERPYKCKLCPKDFPTKDTFKKHMLCHSDERSFKCGECGKLFKRITHAKEHLKIHSNDRPYKCPICKKSFKTATIFKVHSRTHTLHMPWVCKICSKKFREKASLTRHVRVHTGDRPFKCKYCSKLFAEHGTLSRHLRAKVPCSTELAQARRPTLKAYANEEQLQTIVITEDGDIACPTVLSEFSAVVTDTQEYLPPQSDEVGVQPIEASTLDTMEVTNDGNSPRGTYYIVNGEVRLAYPVEPTTIVEQQGDKGDDEVEYSDQPTHAQYVYMENLGDGEDEHPMSLSEQTDTDQVILLGDS